MHLMVYYQTNDDFKMLKKIVNSLSLDVTIHETNDYLEATQMYKNNSYDIVLMDFTSDFSEELIDTILASNISQRIVLLNDEYRCYQNKNCQNCKKKHNIATVIKPINLFQMATILKNDFQCESFLKDEKEFNFEKIVKIILDKYPFLRFNRSKYFFDLSLIVNPLKSSILMELIDVLDKNAIEHYLFDDSLHIVEFAH